MSNPETTDRQVLALVARWTEEAEQQMLALGMSESDQVRHWRMLGFQAERTIEEYAENAR